MWKISMREEWSDLESANLFLTLCCFAIRFSSCLEIPSQIYSVESMLSKTVISWAQSREIIFEASRAFPKVGSSGNLASSSPSRRSLPLSSIASSKNSYLRACLSELSSGRSRKSKLRTSCMSIDFRVSTVAVKLTRLISGRVIDGICKRWKSAV